MFSSFIDVLTVQRLAELPEVIGIKDSSGDISNMLRMIAAISRLVPTLLFLPVGSRQ